MGAIPEGDPTRVFGLAIAYVVPGFLGLWVIATFDPVTANWLGVAARQETTVGAFLFALLASIGLGVFINGVRWHVLEKFLFSRALPEPESEDWKKRKDHADTLVHLQESQYRFFQFYGNTAVALVPALVVAAVSLWDGGRGGALVALLALFLGIEAILLSCALSCYRKYMIRRASLIGTDVA